MVGTLWQGLPVCRVKQGGVRGVLQTAEETLLGYRPAVMLCCYWSISMRLTGGMYSGKVKIPLLSSSADPRH